MAAYTTGASWGFPSDIPDGPTGGERHEVKSEAKKASESFADDQINPNQHSPPRPAMRDAGDAPRPPAPGHAAQPENPGPSGSEHHEQRHWPRRTCRICLESVPPTFHPPSEFLPSMLQSRGQVTYESEDGGRLLRPCKCKGSQKYVHEGCLEQWRLQDPSRTRNYWQCPTCRYSYHLQRLTWAQLISSTTAQIGLTVAIFAFAIFALGFVADPVINMYLDPYTTISTAGGPTGSFFDDDEQPGWVEHFAKGLASLGLLGFLKFLLTLSPWHWWNMRGTGIMGGGSVGRSGVAGTGRDRMRDISWIAVAIGIVAFLWAVWKGVRAWSKRALQSAREKVMDVQGDDGDDADDDEHER